MKNNTIDAILFCESCGDDREHEIHYHDNQIQSIECKACHHKIIINQEYVKKHYRSDFIERVLSKPRRMSKEMQADLNGFLHTLPYRVVTKPYRVLKEKEEK